MDEEGQPVLDDKGKPVLEWVLMRAAAGQPIIGMCGSSPNHVMERGEVAEDVWLPEEEFARAMGFL